VLPNEVFDLLREVVVHRHASTSHAPIAPATPPLNGYLGTAALPSVTAHMRVG
jgi:hypothetical protein